MMSDGGEINENGYVDKDEYKEKGFVSSDNYSDNDKDDNEDSD